jgi:ferritin-like metal-binding protein YciE
MKVSNLQALLVDELKDLYNAEQQLVKALPKMAKAANSDELRKAFEEHLEQTKGHVERLDRAFESLDVATRGKKCLGMEGLISEGKELLEAEMPEAVLDAGMIGAAQKVEHYEIAAYGTARRHAELLQLDDIVRLLEQTLDEEKQTDNRLTDIAETINLQAEQPEGSEDEEAVGALSDNGKRHRVSARG